jgi:hypothetical protein
MLLALQDCGLGVLPSCRPRALLMPARARSALFIVTLAGAPDAGAFEDWSPNPFRSLFCWKIVPMRSNGQALA